MKLKMSNEDLIDTNSVAHDSDNILILNLLQSILELLSGDELAEVKKGREKNNKKMKSTSHSSSDKKMENVSQECLRFSLQLTT